MKYWVTITLLLVVTGAYFYWTKIRPEEIRKNCYQLTKIPRENEKNLEWATGKQWGYGEIGNSPRKAEYTIFQKYDWGWVYPDVNWGSSELIHLSDIDRQNYLYTSCLRKEGQWLN